MYFHEKAFYGITADANKACSDKRGKENKYHYNISTTVDKIYAKM